MQEIFQKSLEFIEHLKKELIEGDEDGKKAAARMMKELYQHMTEHTKIMCDKAGLTEEELIANAENPANFTLEQWQEMQESKQRLAQAGDDLVKLLQPQKSKSTEETAPSPESMIKTSSEKKDQKKRKAKKSQWMRS